MASEKLSRRALLRGVGGIAIALPLLEIMVGRPQKSFAGDPPASPRRFVVMFGGFSLGAARVVNNSGGIAEPVDFVPTTIGAGYDLPAAIAPLGDFNVESEVSVVSGLQIPWAAQNGGTIPAGGRPDAFHAMTASALLSGVRSTDGSGQSSHAYCEGPTADQLVASAIGGGTLFPSREYRAQALFYSGNGPDNARDLMSWKRGSDGKAIPNPPEASPAAAFTTLFENVAPPANPDEAKKRDFLLRSRKSVLDLVAGDTGRLVSKLGREDEARINQHLQEIRDLEQRLQASAAVGGTCPVPASPLADPPIDDGTNYSGEDDRAARFCDLIALAFACDLTRVATLMLTTFQSSLNMGPLIGTTAGLHDIGHKFDKGTANKAIAWHIKHYARLVAKLRDTKTPTGTLLDDAAILFLCEGGVGVDPSVGADASVHSSENMACLIAGHAGGLTPGKHVVATGKAPANVVISAMQAVGVQGGLGEVSGSIPELFA